VGIGPARQRTAVGVEHAEVADEALEPVAVAGRGDDGVAEPPGPVAEHHVVVLDAVTSATTSMRPSLSAAISPSAITGVRARRR
jgi:hypothetical protein